MADRKAISLADHFDDRKLLHFTSHSILTMIFTSIYGIVDGFFVSNYAGEVAFAALNLVMPLLMLIAAVGFMFGTGGVALVSLKLGQKEERQAKEIFSLTTYTLMVLGILLSLLGYLFAPQAAVLLGASEELIPYSVLYARISMVSMTAFMLQHFFQSFLIAAERPRMGFWITVIAGVTNMILDYVFVAGFGLGLAGAAWATVGSELVGGLVPLVFFTLPNKTPLRLGKTGWMPWALVKTCTNGSSEFLSNAAASFIGMLYNRQLLCYMGTNGIAAYGVIMYVNFIFVGIFFGYAMGVSPIISYQYGARNQAELRNLFRRSLSLLTGASLILTLLAELSAGLLAGIFVGYNPQLYALTVHGMRIYSVAYLFMGFNIFGSALFTALGNGKVSAILSLVRSVLLQVVLVLLLPLILGGTSLWMIAALVETGAILLTGFLVARYREKYRLY